MLGGAHSYDDRTTSCSRELGRDDDPDASSTRSTRRGGPQIASLASAQALLDVAARARAEDRSRRELLARAGASAPRATPKRSDSPSGSTSMVFSEEAGVTKPAPEIFLRALGELGVEAADTMFVGDNLDTDVQGAANVGMTTVQALWFRADDTPGIEPDFMAFTPMDVLNAVAATSALSAKSQVLRPSGSVRTMAL